MDIYFKEFENKIGISFNNKKLLKSVFVHRSYLNEHPNLDVDHNERLEFLGDAVLELIVTEYLYKNYSNPEGELTNWRSALVKGVTLSQLAQDIQLDHLMYLSKGESKSSGKSRQLILANAFEALIGAIYLDQGYNITQNFIQQNLICKLPNIIKNKLYMDAKSSLQEMAQDKLSVTPQYKVMSESGPDHNKLFNVAVYIDDKNIGEGTGSSKQEAEQAAAEEAIRTWNSN